MKLIAKLLFGQIRLHPARFLLTTLAVVASAGVVIWVVSGYEALVAQFDDFADQYLGRYQMVVAPAVAPTGTSPPLSPIPRELAREMSRDPGVQAIDFQVHVQIYLEKGKSPREGATKSKGVASKGPPAEGEAKTAGGPPRTGRRALVPPLSPTLVGTSASEPPYSLVEGRWIGSQADGEAAISRGSAEDFQVKVGDTVRIRTNQTQSQSLQLTVVGIVDQAGRRGGGSGAPDPSRGPATSALYIPLAVAETLRPSPEAISLAQVLLTDDTQPSDFRSRWTSRLAAASPPLVFLTAEDVEADLEQSRSASSARNQAYSATGIALLAALFIIFTALSMGVHERTRQFAVLRAVSLTPGQIGLLIAMESLLLGAVGWLGGLAAGWGLLQLMHIAQPALFTESVSLGMWCVMLSGACAFGGALAASILPAWRAMRISPLEAMSTSTTPLATRSVGLMSVAGFLLILINPLLVFAWPMQDQARYPIYVAIGCSTMAIGFILLAPGIVQLVERTLGPWVARLLGLNPRLLAAELSSNLWRTVGTCVALTLGLGLYVATQIWGYSMLQPFMPGAWVPDLMVNFRNTGMPDEEFATVAGVKGFRSQSCLPLAVEQPLLVEDLTGSAERRSVSRQDNMIVIGLDPERGISNADALLRLNFVAGNRESAAKQMREGRGCIVPDHFAREAHLSLGSKFAVIPPETTGRSVEYTVAGIVEMPGWHWMTKFSGLRRRHGRAAAIVLTDFNTARQDFSLASTNFFWTQMEAGASQEEIGKSLKEIADRYPGAPQPVNYQGTWKMGSTDIGSAIRLSSPNDVRSRLALRADGMIWGMSQLPLVTLAIAGLGVLNTIMASIRARSWNIGVMRAVGLTRFSLARLILAESLLTGLVACGLSLAFGILAGWCGAGMSQYVSFFGGLNPSLVIPWPQLLWGIGATLVLCIIAALWPALRVSRMELLTLLQAGRSSL